MTDRTEPREAAPAARPPALQAYTPKDPEALARNISKAVELASTALATALAPKPDRPPAGRTLGEHTAEVMKTLTKVSEYWGSDPQRFLDAQLRLWANYAAIWSSAVERSAGREPKSNGVATPRPDKRFADPEWMANPAFDALRQLYLATSRWTLQLVEEAEGLDERTRQKARFYVEQINNAVAPSNFPFLNPEVLKETAETNGENLVRGMKLLADDLAQGRGLLTPRQTDGSRFKVGENLATTPGKVVFQNDVFQLLQYVPTTESVLKRPLLIVPPWINKFYILDLNEEKSFIRWAVGEGHTVFVISWVNPDERQASKSFEHYMREGVLTALDAIEEATGEREVNAIGYCVGGTLLAVTLAWCAAKGDDRIRSATFFTTQVDFTKAGDLLIFADAQNIDAVEREMEGTGYLDGSKMATAFNLLRSNDLIWPYVVNNYLKGREPFPFDLLYWNSDSTRMPAANHSFYLRNCYLENNLAKGCMEVGGVRLDLKKVTIPIYNLAAREDHIAPAESVYVGSRLFGGPVEFVLAGSGHIAGVVNPPAKRKYQYWTGGDTSGDLKNWIATAEETPGSWWPHWHAWVEALAPERVPARQPGGGRLAPIEDAPGSYVRDAA